MSSDHISMILKQEWIVIVLLILHISCGSLAILSAFGALCTTKGQTLHRRFGRFFFYGMTGVFITAIPLSIIKHHLFLFLIAIFSYYLAFSGWRFANNRTGQPAKLDWTIAVVTLLTAVFMIFTGWTTFNEGDYRPTVLLVFGGIGVILSVSNLRTYYYHKAVGNYRIAQHLTAMLGATIAALTAFSVTNLSIQPAIILWLGPTILLVPVITYWKARVLSGKM